MSALLSENFKKRVDEIDPPTGKDWRCVEEKFGCEFPDVYIDFQSIFAGFIIPIEIYNISTGRTNGDDLVSLVYDTEVGMSDWDTVMIPICGLGNGDYFCFKASEGKYSSVYFRDHSDNSITKYNDTFEEWIRGLKEFAG